MKPTHRTTLVRRIAADPTGTALLLAGPTALELWPGVRRVADVGGRVVVETELGADRVVAASVRAEPPHRTPSSYVTRFAWSGSGLPATEGELTLHYATGEDGGLATEAELVLDSEQHAELDELGLRAMARGFLDNLAAAAELRSHAA